MYKYENQIKLNQSEYQLIITFANSVADSIISSCNFSDRVEH